MRILRKGRYVRSWSLGFYSVVKIQIMGSGSASTQSRLIDYLVVVGVRKPTVDSTETPVLLRRFPQKDHKDCVSPGDVVFFVNWKDAVL